MKIDNYKNIEFLNIADPGTFLNSTPVLFKYMSLENAISTLEKQTIWLANPGTWKDPFEKRFLYANYSKASGRVNNFPYFERTFATCLTCNSSSEAQWNAYSENEIGIRFKINTEVLLEQLDAFALKHPKYKVFFGKVEYHKREEIKTEKLSKLSFEEEGKGGTIKKSLRSIQFCARLLLLKRKDFEYEDEYRIIVFKDVKSKEAGIGFNYSCVNNRIFPLLTISPSVKQNVETMLKDYLKRFNMDFYVDSGGRHRPRIEKCHLYDENERGAKIKTS